MNFTWEKACITVYTQPPLFAALYVNALLPFTAKKAHRPNWFLYSISKCFYLTNHLQPLKNPRRVPHMRISSLRFLMMRIRCTKFSLILRATPLHWGCASGRGSARASATETSTGRRAGSGRGPGCRLKVRHVQVRAVGGTTVGGTSMDMAEHMHVQPLVHSCVCTCTSYVVHRPQCLCNAVYGHQQTQTGHPGLDQTRSLFVASILFQK